MSRDAHPLEIDLVTKLARKAVDDALLVVARAVEASVNDLLNPAAKRLEECRHDQGRCGHGDGVRPSHRLEDRRQYDDDGDEYEREQQRTAAAQRPLMMRSMS